MSDTTSRSVAAEFNEPDRSPALRNRSRRLTLQDIEDMGEKVSNWGRWGSDDEIGTLNHITPERIIAAASCVRKGKPFCLSLNFGQSGPQKGTLGRVNPIHLMRHDGADGIAGKRDHTGIRGADDWLIMPLQSATHWDALSHIFYHDKMYNGYDASLVNSWGAEKCGIEKTRESFVGRGVLLDIPRLKGVDHLENGTPVTPEDLDAACETQNIDVMPGDFVLVRTGQLGAYQARGDWADFAGGDAPGLSFETAQWLFDKEVAGVACDTWGCEVRPNDAGGLNQPWHWVVIPKMGLSMGEMFVLDALAEDCADDGVYSFLLVAPAMPVEKAVGAPTVPMAIK